MLLVAANRQVVGAIGLRDSVRQESKDVLEELRTAGIQQFAILTGDRLSTASSIAGQLGLSDQVDAEMLPLDKANWIEEQSKQGARVAMVGDGVNDAPALVVAFICNHCPYVKAIIDKITRDASDIQMWGIGVAAICANDASSYPADSFANMKIFSERNGFTFSYLHDESQAVARAYDAICTPDFFGFDAADELQYRGRLDESKTTPVPNAKRELLEAMRQIAETGQGPREQIASVGCSIKWKRAP